MAANGSHELVTDSIYTALIQLMKTKPYPEIKIKDIVDRAGVSRMAYYRNFETKDEILTKRLKIKLEGFEQKLENHSCLTEEAYWIEFFEAFQTDSVIVHMMKAGLVNQIMQAHKEFTLRMYEQIFHWDMSDPHNLMVTYQRMGCVIGLMLYSIEHQEADSHLMAQQISQLIIKDQQTTSF